MISEKEIFEWDVENWSKVLDFWLQNSKLDISCSYALDVGAYNGGISLFLAEHGVKVVCSDRQGPTEKAKQLHIKYGFSDRISYADVDVTAIPFPDNSFDIVTFKSVLGALGTYKNQEKMINEIYRVLKPGGELWFAENLKASILHRAARKFFRGSAWRYPSLKEMDSLCKPFVSKSLKPYGFSAAFGRIESLQTLLGKIDRILDGIIPSRWKYIVFGVARK